MQMLETTLCPFSRITLALWLARLSSSQMKPVTTTTGVRAAADHLPRKTTTNLQIGGAGFPSAFEQSGRKI